MSKAPFTDVLTAIDALSVAAERRQAGAIRVVLDSATDSLGPGPCIDDVLMPAVRRIVSRQRAEDRTDVVSVAVETARAWLESMTARAPAPQRRPPLVLACGPGDRHSLGLEALAMLLRSQRQPCRLLGARASAARISVAVEVNRPAAVVLVTHRASSVRASVDVLHALHLTGTMTFYAGAAFDTADARQDLPGTYLGVSFQGARTTILRKMPAQWGSRSPWSG